MLPSKGKIGSSYRGKTFDAHLSKLISPTFFLCLNAVLKLAKSFRPQGFTHIV